MASVKFFWRYLDVVSRQVPSFLAKGGKLPVQPMVSSIGTFALFPESGLGGEQNYGHTWTSWIARIRSMCGNDRRYGNPEENRWKNNRETCWLYACPERKSRDAARRCRAVFWRNYEKKYDAQLVDYAKQVEKDHGRIEIRECWCTDDIEWLSQKDDWNNLQSISLLRSTRIIDDTETTEDRLYISSLPADAQKHNVIIRKHWGIENSLHWVLDMAFDEDHCRKRKNHAAENFAIVRHVALNLLKQQKDPKVSIRRQRLMAGWDSDYLEKIIFQA